MKTLFLLSIALFSTIAHATVSEDSSTQLVCGSYSSSTRISCVSKASIAAAQSQDQLNKLQIKIAEKQLKMMEDQELKASAKKRK